MPTQISIERTDIFIPWWKSADSVDVYMWLTRGGQIIAGDPDFNVGPATRVPGNTVSQDVFQTMKDYLQAATGDIPDAYTPLDQYFGTVFGIGLAEEGNTVRPYPFVGIACQGSYEWGLLNVPPRVTDDENAVPMKWNFRFKAQTFGSANASPLYSALDSYMQNNDFPPTLMTLELDPS